MSDLKSYKEQRRERLNEIIFDYLADEESSAEELMQDITDEVRGTHEYFARYESKCSNLLRRLVNVGMDDNYEYPEPLYDDAILEVGDNLDQAVDEVIEDANQKKYREIVKNWEQHKSKNAISQATDSDWVDFWSYIQSDEC